MDIGAIFFFLALLLLVGLFVARPILEDESKTRHDPSILPQDHERSTLMAKSDRILVSLQELDFDYAVGKIYEQDYSQQRESLLTQGAEVLQKLDEVNPRETIPELSIGESEIGEADPIGEDVYQEKRHSESIVDPDDDIEVLLAERRRTHNEKGMGFCPRCGNSVRKSDIFCPKCGEKIN
jgi:hypothetical protein